MKKNIKILIFIVIILSIILWIITNWQSLNETIYFDKHLENEPIVGKWEMFPTDPHVVLDFKPNGNIYYNENLSGTWDIIDGRLVFSEPLLKSILVTYNKTIFDFEIVNDELQIHLLDKNMERLNSYLRFNRL